MTPDPLPALPHFSLTRRRFLGGSALIAAGALAPLEIDAQTGGRPAAAPGATRPASRTQRGPILRYYVPPETRDEHLAELIATCERTGITAVSLFTTEYLGISQFKEMAELERICAHLSTCAARLKAAGLAFHLNVFHTLGHLYASDREIRAQGFQRQIHADGRPGAHPVLDPSCPRLGAYLQEAYRRYAHLRPELLFADDDYTVKFSQCFAPGRVARFAARFGCAADPVAIDSLLTGGDRAARALMSELITDDLASLAATLREVVHGVSPDTRLGYMHADTVTHDVSRVARAFAGNQRPFVRPQIQLYRENAPLADYPERFWGLDGWRARLPDEIEFFPECENYPYDPALKSPVAAFAHHAYILSIGQPRVALSLNGGPDANPVPAAESRSLVEYFAARRGQLSTVDSLLQGRNEPIGVAVWQDPTAQTLGLWRKTSLKALHARGVPLRCVRRAEEAVLLWGDSLQHLDEAGLDKVLQQGGFLDLRALQTLRKRGLLERIGLTLGDRCAATDVMHVRYDRQDGGSELWPYYYFVGRVPGKEHLPFRVSAKDATTLVTYLDELRQVSAPHLLTWTSPAGARFALLNAETDTTTGESLLSRWSAPCLVRAIEWVQGKAVPSVTLSEGSFLLKALRLGTGDQALLTLWNLSTAPAPAAAIRLAGDLAPYAWSRIDPVGQLRPLVTTARNGRIEATLDETLPSLGCCFLLGQRTP